MSQPTSSILSNENPDIKYKKALKEISKLITANKALREESNEIKKELEVQISNQNDLVKDYQSLKKQKEVLQKYMEQMQESNRQLLSDYHNLERQVSYLNEALAQKTAQMGKVNTSQQQKGISALIHNYEQKQGQLRKDIFLQQQLYRKLQQEFHLYEDQIIKQRQLKQTFEDQYNNLNLEINKYRQLNKVLIEHNENIIMQIYGDNGKQMQKQMNLEALTTQFKEQLEMMKNSMTVLGQNKIYTVKTETYHELLRDKNKIQLEYKRMKEQFDESQKKIKQMYDMEENMKIAMNKCEKLTQQCNMLKSKIIVTQAKDMLEDNIIDDEIEFKQFQQKIGIMVSHNDPLNSIKNSDDSSHFRILKTFIGQLQEKLGKVSQERRKYKKQYQLLKNKTAKKIQKSIYLEDQNKLLKGKVEGYERLSEKLNFQLQKNITIHEQEIMRMTTVSNTLINKRIQQAKVTIAFIKSQNEMEKDRFDKIERNLKQELQTTKLQLSAEKIKTRDLDNKSKQVIEVLEVTKNKFNEQNSKYIQLQEENQEVVSNVVKYQQLYREEKIKSEEYLTQKGILMSKINQVKEEAESKIYQCSEEVRNKEQMFQNENRKLKLQNAQLKEQIQKNLKQIKNLKSDLEDRRLKQSIEIQTFKQNSTYYSSLDHSYTKQKEKCQQLLRQLEHLRLKLSNANANSEKTNILQENVMKRTDEINDLKRKMLLLEKQNQMMSIKLVDEKKNYEQAKKELSDTKMRVMQTTHELHKQYGDKDTDLKKVIQKLNENIILINSDLRESKTKQQRIQNQLIQSKSQISRLESLLNKIRKQKQVVTDQLRQLQIQVQNMMDQNEKNKVNLRYQQEIVDGQNLQLQKFSDKLSKKNQQVSTLRVKLDTSEEQNRTIIRQISTLKIYLVQSEEFINRSKDKKDINWQDGHAIDNIKNLIDKIKKLLKTNEISSHAGSTAEYSIRNKNQMNSYNTTSFNPINYNSRFEDEMKVTYRPIVDEKQTEEYSLTEQYRPIDDYKQITGNYQLPLRVNQISTENYDQSYSHDYFKSYASQNDNSGNNQGIYNISST